MIVWRSSGETSVRFDVHLDEGELDGEASRRRGEAVVGDGHRQVVGQVLEAGG